MTSPRVSLANSPKEDKDRRRQRISEVSLAERVDDKEAGKTGVAGWRTTIRENYPGMTR